MLLTCDDVTPFLFFNIIHFYVMYTCTKLYLPKLPSSTTSNLEKGEVSIMRDVVPLSTIL